MYLNIKWRSIRDDMGVLSPHMDYDAIKGGGLGLTHGIGLFICIHSCVDFSKCGLMVCKHDTTPCKYAIECWTYIYTTKLKLNLYIL